MKDFSFTIAKRFQLLFTVMKQFKKMTFLEISHLCKKLISSYVKNKETNKNGRVKNYEQTALLEKKNLN